MKYYIFFTGIIFIGIQFNTSAQDMKKNKAVQLFGIEYQRPPRKERAQLMEMVAKARPDLDSYEHYTQCFELKDGSILEIFIYDIPKESDLTLFKNEEDYKKMLQKLRNPDEESQRYNGVFTYQIISFRKEEIPIIEKEHLNILANSLKLNTTDLNYTKESLKLLEQYFMRITESKEYDDNPLYKSLFYYLAIILKNHMEEGKLDFEIEEDGLVSSINVIDKNGKSYQSALDIYTVWAEGPEITLEFTEDKRKKKQKLTLDVLFEVELGKYKHTLPSKPSFIFENVQPDSVKNK